MLHAVCSVHMQSDSDVYTCTMYMYCTYTCTVADVLRVCCVQGLSELTVQQERERSETLLKELLEREAEKAERRMEEQHSRYNSITVLHIALSSVHVHVCIAIA